MGFREYSASRLVTNTAVLQQTRPPPFSTNRHFFFGDIIDLVVFCFFFNANIVLFQMFLLLLLVVLAVVVLPEPTGVNVDITFHRRPDSEIQSKLHLLAAVILFVSKIWSHQMPPISSIMFRTAFYFFFSHSNSFSFFFFNFFPFLSFLCFKRIFSYMFFDSMLLFVGRDRMAGFVWQNMVILWLCPSTSRSKKCNLTLSTRCHSVRWRLREMWVTFLTENSNIFKCLFIARQRYAETNT